MIHSIFLHASTKDRDNHALVSLGHLYLQFAKDPKSGAKVCCCIGFNIFEHPSFITTLCFFRVLFPIVFLNMECGAAEATCLPPPPFFFCCCWLFVL